jgi:hypothetical protein
MCAGCGDGVASAINEALGARAPGGRHLAREVGTFFYLKYF